MSRRSLAVEADRYDNDVLLKSQMNSTAILTSSFAAASLIHLAIINVFPP